MLDREKAILLEKNIKTRMSEISNDKLAPKLKELLIPAIIIALQEYEKINSQNE